MERDLKVSFRTNLYRYQNYNSRKIDSVVELNGGKWCVFKIKPGIN